MCGINGILFLSERNDLDVRIAKMNGAIEHRGPDAEGFFSDKKRMALGHRRLSIIDTSEGANQPMVSQNNKWQIVFNGEIYNFREIKEHLAYDFVTQSDTEVILASVQLHGVEWFVEKANGMFAIALYNTSTQELWLIRDRLGIKPLYYYHGTDYLVFSSEIKGILHSGLVEADFNSNAVDEYLANRYIRAPYTFFKNIYQLLPGSMLKFDRQLTRKELTYWTLPEFFNFEKKFDEKAILDDFDKALTKAIKYRLISDVPLGTYLSGGVDSSIITAITAQNMNEPVNTYTIGFPGLNEFNYSEIVASQYKTIHHKIQIDRNDYVKNWERLIKYKDAPLGVPNEIPLAIMSSKLKEKITVVLSGEGADELLGGYGKIFRSPFDYQNIGTTVNYYQFLISQYEYVPRIMRDQLLNTPYDYRDEFDQIVQSEFDGRANEENVFRFFHNYHVKGLLQRVDMTTMQTSVEARVPFLDHELIEFAYTRVPYNLKLKWSSKKAEIEAKTLLSTTYSEKLDTPKYLLRKLAYKYLPAPIVERKKVGFPVPLSEWFSNLETLAKELLPTANWLKKDTTEKLLIDSKDQSRAGQVLWMFINIELFRKNYFEKNWKW